jgi:hypothetical protein
MHPEVRHRSAQLRLSAAFTAGPHEWIFFGLKWMLAGGEVTVQAGREVSKACDDAVTCLGKADGRDLCACEEGLSPRRAEAS